MKRLITFSLLSLFLFGCVDRAAEFSERIDSMSFSCLGRTFFAEATKVPIKEVHLENSMLVGRSVVIEGTLVEVGKFYTFAVIADDSARMLVVLTDIDTTELLKQSGNNKFSVLGDVGSGKHGLPYIQARALRRI